MTSTSPDQSYEPTLQELLDTMQPVMVDSVTTGNSGSPALCPICVVVEASVIRGLRSLFAEFVNDPDCRMKLRAAKGFCRLHRSAVMATGDALGTAILYADLTELAIEGLSATTNFKDRLKRFQSSSSTPACPACSLETEADARYTSALAMGLAKPIVWETLKAGSGLCMNHYSQTARAATVADGERLKALQTEKLNALLGELQELIRKNDYRFRQEEWGQERDSWIRAQEIVTRPR